LARIAEPRSVWIHPSRKVEADNGAKLAGVRDRKARKPLVFDLPNLVTGNAETSAKLDLTDASLQAGFTDGIGEFRQYLSGAGCASRP
jgi:hypothetical protein